MIKKWYFWENGRPLILHMTSVSMRQILIKYWVLVEMVL